MALHRGSFRQMPAEPDAGLVKYGKRQRGEMVGVARIELATPAMSTQCSTTELYAHAARALAAQLIPFKPEKAVIAL